MPDFIATAPDGRKFKITAPEGATPDQMRAYAEQNMGKLQPAGGQVPGNSGQLQQADGMVMSGLKGAGEGFARTMLGGQQLVGKGLSAVGAKGVGGWLEKDAEKGLASEAASTAADRKAHPWATEIGELLGGGVLPGGVAGKVAGKAGPVAQAALSGGITGMLEPVERAGNYWWDKAKSIGVGSAAGSVLGTLAAKVGSPAVKGVTGDAKALIDAGVKLTPGQMIGGVAKGIEEKATSAPITGHFISNALHETTKSFNIATINKALAPIGAKLPSNIQAGHDAIAAAQKALGTAYDTILPKMSLRMDKGFADEVGRVVQDARSGILPKDKSEQFEAYLKSRILAPFQQSGNRLSGDQLKKIEADLTERASRYTDSRDVADRDMADAINTVKTSLRDALTRQNPNYAPELQKVNQGYAMFTRIQNAAQRRVTSGGVFTPGDLLGAVKATDKSVRKGAFARGDALLQDWAETGQKVIGNRTPDSGTAGRLGVKDLLGASAGPLSAIPLAGAGLPYTKAGQAAVQGAATVGQAARKPLAKAVAGSGLYLAPGAAQAANGATGQ